MGRGGTLWNENEELKGDQLWTLRKSVYGAEVRILHIRCTLGIVVSNVTVQLTNLVLEKKS